MGLLSYFDLASLISRYGATTLVETGAGTGTGLRHAQGFGGFSRIWSCEIDKEQTDKLNAQFLGRDNRVRVFNLDSESFLRLVLGAGSLLHDPIIFFLDAHFPGADLGKASFDAEPDLDKRLPLARELGIIHELRVKQGHLKDVLLLDDLRCYERLPTPGSNLSDMGLEHLMRPGTEWLEPWRETHTVTKLYSDTGYVSIIPA